MAKFEESAVCMNMYSVMTEAGIGWGENYSAPATKAFIDSVVSYLAFVKNEAPIGFKYVEESGDNKGKFIFGGWVEKVTSEEGENYSINFTFDENDIPEGTKMNTMEDPTACNIIQRECSNKYHMRINLVGGVDMTNMVAYKVFNTIKEYFRMNVGTDPVLELDGFCTFKATIVDEKLVVAVELDPAVKQMVKDDASVEQQPA